LPELLGRHRRGHIADGHDAVFQGGGGQRAVNFRIQARDNVAWRTSRCVNTEHGVGVKAGGNGLRTIVNMQFVGRTRYFDAAGFPGRTVGLKVPASAR
jgi:hypothetical protein